MYEIRCTMYEPQLIDIQCFNSNEYIESAISALAFNNIYHIEKIEDFA
jgi:hypothetical protein